MFILFCGVSFLILALNMQNRIGMQPVMPFILLVSGLIFLVPVATANEVSAEERIREFQKPRGLSSSSSSKSSSSNSKASNSQGAQNTSSSNDPYAAMAKSFSDQMAANSKANEEIQKLVPKAESEPDYLKNLAGAIKGGGSNSNVVATLAQITEATIASIRTLAEMQIAIEKSKAEDELAQLRKKQNQIRNQELQEKVAGLSPMAVALGAVKNSNSDTPSPISMRTKISTEPNHSTSKGLFPSSLQEFSVRAYNAPR